MPFYGSSYQTFIRPVGSDGDGGAGAFLPVFLARSVGLFFFLGLQGSWDVRVERTDDPGVALPEVRPGGAVTIGFLWGLGGAFLLSVRCDPGSIFLGMHLGARRGQIVCCRGKCVGVGERGVGPGGCRLFRGRIVSVGVRMGGGSFCWALYMFGC